MPKMGGKQCLVEILGVDPQARISQLLEFGNHSNKNKKNTDTARYRV
jgi:hypothetical protein